jgi:DNA mismatch repair protein MutS
MQSGQVPENYIRKQTLVNGERFFTPELKEYESLILNARDRMAEMETDLFRRVCGQVAASSEAVLALGGILAEIDVLASLAESAVRCHYVRPELDNSTVIDIVQGRHPVVERNLDAGTFIPKDIRLSNDDARSYPRSQHVRQDHLSAQARSLSSWRISQLRAGGKARIGIVDRIFHAHRGKDDLAAGQSTSCGDGGTANILNNATRARTSFSLR